MAVRQRGRDRDAIGVADLPDRPERDGRAPHHGEEGSPWADTGRREIALICDDIAATVAELRGRGAEFDGEPEDMGFGVGTHLRVPAAGRVLLYEVRHPTAYDL